MPKSKLPQLDAANVASRFPRSMQWPAGAILGGLQSAMGGDDPTSAIMTTIGPNAIPLAHGDEYLRKAAGTAIDDLGSVYSKVAYNPMNPIPARHWAPVAAAITNPSLQNKVYAAHESPGIGQSIMKHWGQDTQGSVEKLIQALADAYHTSLR